MYVLKVSDGFPQFQNMKKAMNCNYLIVLHCLELNAVTPSYGVNLFIFNMLFIKIDVRFPNLLVRPIYFTYSLIIVFFQSIKFDDKQFLLMFNYGVDFALNHLYVAIWPNN
jgi:hypothetical protein